MMDCKSALVEANGDIEKARDILRKKGLAAAAKKAGRAASEGVVGTYIHPGAKIGVLVEVNCETDFVAKTPEFQALVKDDRDAHRGRAVALYVTKEEVPGDVLEKEKEIYKAQAAAQGKPAHVQEKIAEGKLKEYYADLLPARAALRQGPDKLTVGPARPGEDRAHQGEHRGAPFRPLQGRRRGAAAAPAEATKAPVPAR